MSRIVITNEAEAKAPKHGPGVFFLCDRCRQIKPTETSATGYGYRPGSDRMHCFQCCGQTDRIRMTAEGKATLYLSKLENGYVITNWPGTLRLPCAQVKKLRHPFARDALMAYFTGPDGKPWSGRNIGDNQVAHCRRLKR